VSKIACAVLALVVLGAWAPRAHAQSVATLAEEQVSIETDERFRAGEADAPVVMTVYACGRSAVCAKSIPALYGEVTSGRFKGRVKLYYRPFFPEAQVEAAECGRALVAAANESLFWPYLLHLYANNEDFKACMLRRWAEIKGLDSCAFQVAYDDPKTLEYLAAVRREAARNGVDAAPTVFINGRKVLGALTVDAIFHLLDQECARTAR